MSKNKPPRPTTIEKIQAKRAAEPQIMLQDLQNLTLAARRTLGALQGADLQHVTNSILVVEGFIAHRTAQAQAQQQVATPPPPAAAAPATAEPAKG